jgi:hypothetical protein
MRLRHPKPLVANGFFCALRSKVADQDLKRNAQQFWQTPYVLALLTKHNETAIFLTSRPWMACGAHQ